MLTGRTRFRAQRLTGLLVLQVETREGHVGKDWRGAQEDTLKHDWRDAITEDLAELHHLTYGRIDIALRLPSVPDELPGDRRDPRSTTH